MAHLLTGVRLGLALPLAAAFARPDFLDASLVAALLATALATDSADGLVARRRGTASAGGRLFDHATDCFFVTAGLTGAALAGLVPPALPVLVAAAFGQYVFDSYLVHRQKRLRMSAVGRWNGIGYFVPLVVVATARLEVPGLTGLMPAARLTAYVLIVSTVVSVVDRATAARRARAGQGVFSPPAGVSGARARQDRLRNPRRPNWSSRSP